MNHQICKCSKCNNSLHYQIPINIAFRIIGLKVYWCTKCDVNTHVWPWNLNVNEPLGENNKMYHDMN